MLCREGLDVEAGNDVDVRQGDDACRDEMSTAAETSVIATAVLITAVLGRATACDISLATGVSKGVADDKFSASLQHEQQGDKPNCCASKCHGPLLSSHTRNSQTKHVF